MDEDNNNNNTPPPSPPPARDASKSASAGPSNANGSNGAASNARSARWRPLPRTTYRSIEYPGPMQRPGQILQVVTQTDVDECFNAPMSEFRQLEMKYRPQERSSIPVRGSRVASQKVLVKVVKKRKRARGGVASDEGVFTANIVGSIPQTVRFRCRSTARLVLTAAMADYQYTPPQDGHVSQLVQSLMDLDCR